MAQQDDVIRLRLALDEATVQQTENRVRNFLNRLNNQTARFRIEATNFDTVNRQLDQLQARIQQLQNASINLNSNSGLTEAQQMYRLETQRLAVQNRLALARERTAQSENRAIAALATENRTLTVNRNIHQQIQGEVQHTHQHMRNLNAEANNFANTLQRSLTAFIGYRIINLVTSSIREAYSELKNMDTEMVEIRKVTSATATDMERLNKSALGAAKAFGRSPSEYLSSVSSFAKAGYDAKSEELGELAMLAENVGDLDNELANQFLVSADAAWKLNGDISALTRILDGFNELSNKTATTQEDLADGIRVAGSVFAQAELSAQDYSALVGTAQAKTQESGAVAARGLRTVLLNLRQIRGTDLETGEIIDEEKLAKAERSLKEIGISIRETVDGVIELRNPMDVLEELASRWEHLSSVQQSAIQESLANKRQSNIFTAVMENWADVEKASEIYANSAGSAMRENEIYLDSWNAKIEKVKTSWTSYIGGLQDTSTIKSALDTLTSFIDALDSEVGRTITQVVVLVSTLALLNRGFAWVSQLQAFQRLNLSLEIARITAAQFGFGAAVRTVTTTLLQQATAWAMTPFGMVTIAVGAISLITSAVEKYNESLREAATASTEQAEKSSENVAQLLELKAQLTEGTTSTDELTNALKEQLLQMGYTETEIDKLIEKYGGLAGAMDEATQKAWEKVKTDAYADVSTTSDLLENEAKGNSNVAVTYAQNPELASQIREMLEDSPATLDGGVYRLNKNANAEDIYTYYNTLKNISRLIQETASETDNESLLSLDAMSPTSYKMVTDSINALSDAADKYGTAISRLHSADAQLELSDYLKSNSVKSKAEFDKYIKSIQDSAEHSEEYKNVLIDVANKAFPQFTKQAENAAETVDDLSSSVETFSKKLDSIQEAYQTAEAAIAEFNKQGYLSLDTYQKLMELQLEYLSMLVDENGNLNLNSEAVNENTAAYIENMGIKTAQNLIDKVTAISDEREQLKLLTGAVNENTKATWDNIAAQLSSISSIEVKDALTERINAIKAMTDAAKAGIGKGGLSKSADKDKESLNALKAEIEAGELALQKFNDELERLSTLEDLTFENDYISKIQTVTDKLNATTRQAVALRGEISRLMSITPKNADEAAEISKQVETLSKYYLEAQKNALELRRELIIQTAEAYAEISRHVADSSSEALKYIKKLKETTEQGSFLGSRYAQTFIPSGRDDALSRERKENELLLAEEKHYQEAVLELKKKANEMALSEAKATSAEITSTVSTANDKLEQEQRGTNENTTTELKADNANKTMAIQSFFDWCKNQFNTFAGWVKDNPIKTPKIDFSDTEKSLKNFNGGFSVKFANAGETDIVKAASRYAGTSYVWGGDSLSKGGLDCSGFVYNVLNDIGFKVGRTTADGYRSMGNEVEKSDMQYGDLLFFGKENEATHIAIYAGDGKMWESTGDSNNTIWNPGKGVTLSKVDKRSDLMEVRRLPQFASGTQDFGVVGENYKREFAINKKTGQWHEINEPTLFDKSEYDILGEKVSEKINNPIPMFATGTPTGNEAYRKWIAEACDTLGIPNNIALSLIDQESGGGTAPDTWKFNSAGAYGLTQITESAMDDLLDGTAIANKYKSLLESNGIDLNKARGGGEAHARDNIWTGLATLAAIKDKYFKGDDADLKKSLGWYYAGGAWNGSEGQWYANQVVNRANTTPFLELADNTTSTTTTTASTSHTAEIERLVKEVVNRFDEEFVSARNELALISDEKQTENHLKYEEWLKNSPDDFSGLEDILSEGVENFDAFSRDVNSLSISSYQEQINELKGIKDNLIDLYNTAETATEKDAILEQISVLDDSLSEINKNLISIYDAERERLANSVEAIGRRAEGTYGTGISFLEKSAEKLQDEIDDTTNTFEQYEKSLSLGDNYRKQSEMHLQTATDYHNRANELRADEEYVDIFNKYEIDEIFDANNEFNQLYYDYLSTMPENEIEKFRTIAETMQLLKKGYMESREAATDLAKQADKTFSDAKLKKVEQFVELQNRLSDVLDFEIKMNDAITSAKEQMYDFQNTLREEQNNIRTQLKDSMHLSGWLDDETREQLFNLNDYKTEMRVIKQLQSESERLYKNYRAEINSLTEEEAWKEAEITAEYNKQVETLKDKLSIAKQELDVAKKEAALENALRERDTQIIMGNRMVNVHDPDDLYNKAQELSESELELDNQKTISVQNEDIRDMQRNTQLIESERAAIQNRIDMLNSMRDAEKAVLADFIGTMFEISSMLENIAFSNPFYIVDEDNTRSVFKGIDIGKESKGYLFDTNYESIVNRLDEYIKNGLIDKSTADAIREKSMANHDYKTSTDPRNSGYNIHNPNDAALDNTHIMEKKVYTPISWDEFMATIPRMGSDTPEVKTNISNLHTLLSTTMQPTVVKEAYSSIMDKLTSGITASIAGAVNAGSQDNSVHYNIENIEITNPIGSADELLRNLTMQLKSQYSITNNMR